MRVIISQRARPVRAAGRSAFAKRLRRIRRSSNARGRVERRRRGIAERFGRANGPSAALSRCGVACRRSFRRGGGAPRHQAKSEGGERARSEHKSC